jgi:hypothetical protein
MCDREWFSAFNVRNSGFRNSSVLRQDLLFEVMMEVLREANLPGVEDISGRAKMCCFSPFRKEEACRGFLLVCVKISWCQLIILPITLVPLEAGHLLAAYVKRICICQRPSHLSSSLVAKIPQQGVYRIAVIERNQMRVMVGVCFPATE